MSGIIFTHPSPPNRNLFKNPNFAVIQGTASGTIPDSLALPTASLGYLEAQAEWCVAAAGGTPTYAFSSSNESLTITGAAGTTEVYLLQRLESKDTNRLKNKTVTFSCELSNSLLTSATWEVYRPTTTNDTHGTIATPTQTLIASGTFTITSTLTRYSATFDLPDLASRGLDVRLEFGALTSGNSVISRLQLEEGCVATAFNCEDYSKELEKCQRYFRSIFTTLRGDAALAKTQYPGVALNFDMFLAPIVVQGLSAGTSNVADGFPVLNGITNSTANVYIANSEAVGDFYDISRVWNLSSHIP